MDEGVLVACCKAMGRHLFEGSSQYRAVVNGCAFTAAEKVVLQLPEHLLISVLRESGHGLDCHLRRLQQQQLHSVAVHAAFPELAKEGSLVLQCSTVSYGAAAVALGVLTKLPAVTSLSLDDLTLLIDFSEPVSSDVLQFSFALDLALRSCPQHISLKFAAISRDHVGNLMYSMSCNTRIQSLQLSIPSLCQSSQLSLLNGLARLTTLQSLHLSASLEKEAFSEWDELPRPTFSVHVLSSLALLTFLQIDSKSEWCDDMSLEAAVDVSKLSQCLKGIGCLQHLHIPLMLHDDIEFDSLAAALVVQSTCLTHLTLTACGDDSEDEDNEEVRAICGRFYASVPAALASACTNLQHLDLWGEYYFVSDDQLQVHFSSFLLAYPHAVCYVSACEALPALVAISPFYPLHVRVFFMTCDL